MSNGNKKVCGLISVRVSKTELSLFLYYINNSHLTLNSLPYFKESFQCISSRQNSRKSKNPTHSKSFCSVQPSNAKYFIEDETALLLIALMCHWVAIQNRRRRVLKSIVLQFLSSLAQKSLHLVFWWKKAGHRKEIQGRLT